MGIKYICFDCFKLFSAGQPCGCSIPKPKAKPKAKRSPRYEWEIRFSTGLDDVRFFEPTAAGVEEAKQDLLEVIEEHHNRLATDSLTGNEFAPSFDLKRYCNRGGEMIEFGLDDSDVAKRVLKQTLVLQSFVDEHQTVLDDLQDQIETVLNND
jgi:hypothetical protein